MNRVFAVLRAAAVAAVLAGCQSVPASEGPSPSFGEAFTPLDAAAQNAAMGRGVNVLGYDPVWKDPAKARFTADHFRLIRQAGFSNVRIVLQSFDFIDGNGRLDPAWLATLDRMVKAALDQGLSVVLDEHDYELCGKDIVTCRTKLKAFWSQVAPHFKEAPNRVLFEILNEPHEALTDELWNAELKDMLALIRASNPSRTIVIGPGHWNGLEDLPQLQLPADDPHIIVSVHYYHPMAFTHQGAAWVPAYTDKLGVSWGSPADVALLNTELDAVQAWSRMHNRPITLNEFGAYDKAAMADRARWDGAVARAAEARGFSWAYWQFDPDFVLWDFSKPGWVTPILEALIPPGP